MSIEKGPSPKIGEAVEQVQQVSLTERITRHRAKETELATEKREASRTAVVEQMIAILGPEERAYRGDEGGHFDMLYGNAIKALKREESGRILIKGGPRTRPELVAVREERVDDCIRAMCTNRVFAGNIIMQVQQLLADLAINGIEYREKIVGLYNPNTGSEGRKEKIENTIFPAFFEPGQDKQQRESRREELTRLAQDAQKAREYAARDDRRVAQPEGIPPYLKRPTTELIARGVILPSQEEIATLMDAILALRKAIEGIMVAPERESGKRETAEKQCSLLGAIARLLSEYRAAMYTDVRMGRKYQGYLQQVKATGGEVPLGAALRLRESQKETAERERLISLKAQLEDVP